MFEKLLQKVIMSYFGDYLNGIDPNNLHVGIWNGDIRIQNVSLNEHKINHLMLESKLPFDLIFSHIGGLRIIVPWNKLSSMPVEITLTDVYLFLRMKETDSKIELKDIIANKKELVKNYCEHLSTKLLGEKKQEKQQGYLNKMIAKIIDNIQLKIENIHIRIQGGEEVEEVFYSLEEQEDNTVMINQEKSKSFAFGFCIKSINAYTTDDQWNKKFIDRSEKKDTQMRKKLFFEQISLYWEQKDVVPLTSLKAEDTKYLMAEIISRRDKRLLTISGEIKFIEVKDKTKPQYELTTTFEVLKVEMNFHQLKGIIELGQKISEYKSFQKAINLHILPEEQQLKMEEQFKSSIEQQFNDKFEKMPEEFENILIKVNKQNLMKWTKQSMTSIIKRKKIELKQKEKNQKKWWNILSYQEIKITQQQEQEIQKLMNQMITVQDQVERESNSPWIAFNIQIIQGSVAVVHSEIQQLFYLQYQNMIVNFRLLKNKKHFSLNLILEKSSLKYIKHEKQFKSADEIMKQKVQLCEIEIIKQKDLHKNLIQLFISKEQLLVDIKFVTRKVEINYQTRIILLIKELMKVRNNDQLNSIAWNTMSQKIQQKSKQNERNNDKNKVEEPKIEYKINVDVEGVFIIILLEQNQHLVASFNKIWIKDIDANNKKGCIQNLNIRYISKTKADVDNLRYSQLGSEEVYLIHPLNPTFSLEVTQLKNNIKLSIGSINLNLNKTQIVKIRTFVDKQLEIGDQQKKRPYKQIAQQQSQKSGYVQILNTFKTWKKYYAILTDSHIEFYEQDEYQPIVKWFIKNCVITQLPDNKLRLESSSLNEIMKFKEQHEKNQWKSKIQEVVITNTSGAELYEMFDQLESKSKPTVNLQLKQTNFILQIEQLELIFEEQKPVLRLFIGQINAVFVESNYFFNRTITVDKFEVGDLRQSKDSQYYSIIKTNTYSNIHQFNRQQSERLELKVHGKKKFHPNYKGELFIKGSVGGITINFNPRIFLHFVRLLGKKKTKYQFNEKSQREEAIFGYTKNFLQSNFFQELEQSISASKNIENKINFTKFSEFEKTQKVLVMLDVDFTIKSARINLIHRTTKCCNNTILAENLVMNIKNGNSFLFVEMELKNAKIFDISNYPNTINNFENQYDMVPYQLVSPSKPDATIRVWFSTFQNYVFTNLERTTGFFLLTLDDYTIMYQQQPFMRFIDYLNNQLISFILKPYSVDIYEYKYNKQFKFSEYEQFTTKQVEKIIEGLLLPFFNSLTVEVNNSIVHFNSHPGLESLVLNIDKVVVQSKDLFTNNRIEIDQTKLKQCRDRKNFKDLETNKIFSQRILKGCWVQQMIISIKNIQIGSNTSSFDLIIDFERLPNCQRSLLFPFIEQDKTMMLSGVIEKVQIKLTKQFYNLLLKCMIHNLTYDDGKDSLYQHNFKYQHLMQPSPMSNLIKIKNGDFLLPELDARLHVNDFDYWFNRDKDMNKKMMINIKKLEIFKRNEQIVMKDEKQRYENLDEYDLEYQFTSQKNFDKKMTVKCNNLRIFALDMDIFKKIGAFVMVPPECFPNDGVLGDMPMITCNIQLNNSIISFAHFDTFAFIVEGNIMYIWNRNRSRHYDLIKQDRVNGIKVPDVGVTTSHIIYLKGVELKKVSSQQLTFGKILTKQKVRKLSTPINVFLRLNDIFKFSPNHTVYYDKSIYYSLESVGIIMSYEDISEIMGFFKPPTNPEIEQQPPKQPEQFNPYQPSSTTQHNLIIYNLQFQILASSPQAPLMSIHFNDGKLKCTQMRNMIPLHSLFKMGIHYYNLRVGVWEPVVEEVEISLEMKWGSEKYLRVECKESLLIDVSVQFLKLLKLLLGDINSINQQKVTNKNSTIARRQTYEEQNEQKNKMDVKINNMSPYIIINNLGCELTIQSSEGDQRYVLQPCQSVNYQTRSEVINSSQPKKVKLIINDGKSIHQIHDIDLDKIRNKLMRIEFADRFVDIKFIAVYRQIIKEIIISSCYLIKNATTYDLQLQANDKLLKIKKGEESALPYTLLFEQCTFTLNFPHLENVKENFAFSSEVLIPHYQHYIQTSSEIFNCNIQPEEDENNQIMSIVVSPLFVFRNSLPCNIKIQLFWKVNGVEKRIEDELGIQEEKGYHQIGSKDNLEIKVKLPGFHYSQSQQLYDPNNKQYQLEELPINDYRGNTGKVNLKCSKRNRVKRYTFWGTGLIINETNYQLYFYEGGNLIPGQKLQSIGQENRLCFIGDAKSINMSMGDDNANRSEYPLSSALELIELGSNNFSVVYKNRLIQFGVYTDLYCVDNKQSLYSRIIQITPKYIIVNKCSFPIKVKHYLSDRAQSVDVQEKVPLEWDNRHRTKYICVKVESQGKKWNYSEPISFHQNSSIISFALRSQLKTEQKAYMKLEIVKEIQYEYLVVSQVTQQKDYLISVHNQLAYVRVQLYQKVIDQKEPDWEPFKSLKLKENGAIEQYAFDYPNQSKETTVTFKFIGPLRSDYDDYTFVVDLSQQSYSTELIINSNVREKQIIILVTIQSIAGKKNLKFAEKKQNDDHEEMDEFVLLRLGISFKEVGLSLIGQTKGKRCQIIYLTMKQCQLMLLEKSTIRTVQLKIKYINIDNNSNHNSSNPVLFTPQKQQKAMKSPRPFLLFLLEQNLKLRNTNQIKSIRVSIQPTSIRFDDEFFEVINAFRKQINNSTIGIQETDLIPLITPSQFAWINRDFKSLTSETFVQQFEIAKITLKLSFSMRPKGSSNNQLIYMIIKSFGVLLAKISDSYITFSRILLVGRNITQIKKQIASIYYKHFSKTLISVLASVNIFGNPYKLARYIGQGFVDIINYPVQGFIKGPIEGVFGIVGGGVGFLKNIVAGTFNGLQSVSESVSSGLSSLSMDEKFIERRQKIKNHETKHLVSGTVYGLYSVVGGIELALTGLYRQPTEGYHNNGFVGGVAGTLKALAGVFIKPVSGAFEGMSKFSEGIKNTALMFEDGPKTQRERPPRIFYGEEYIYKSYDEEQAQSVAVLQYMSTKYLNIVILELISFDHEDNHEGNMLLISSSCVCLFNRKKKKIYWDEQVSKISHVRIREGAGVMIYTKQKQELFIETAKANELMEKLMLAVKLNERMEGLDDD